MDLYEYLNGLGIRATFHYHELTIVNKLTLLLLIQSLAERGNAYGSGINYVYAALTLDLFGRLNPTEDDFFMYKKELAIIFGNLGIDVNEDITNKDFDIVKSFNKGMVDRTVGIDA